MKRRALYETQQTFKRNVQMLMLHMCAADLLYALITILPTMIITATVPVFYGPNALCKFVKFLQVNRRFRTFFLAFAKANKKC